MCPQLLVKESGLDVHFSADPLVPTGAQILRAGSNEPVLKITVDWPEFADSGSAFTSVKVRLLNTGGDNCFATVVARKPHVVGQGLALCHGDREVFGYVEPHPLGNCFTVRHRSSIMLLTLVGNFEHGDAFNVE